MSTVAGMEVRELTTPGDHHAVAALFARVWGSPGGYAPVVTGTIHAAWHVGGYVAGGFDGDELVGASFGFFAADGHLHSHVTGVLPSHQGRGVGLALKLHQRDWCLARGVTTVSWTFDPLVRRNAWFNVHRLGATPREYLADFYGEMLDEVNAGDATDRLYVTWELDSARVIAALDGTSVESERVDPTEEDGMAVLVSPGPDGPRRHGLAEEARALVAIPPDIERLRVDDADGARAWRLAVRESLTSAMAAGFEIRGVRRQGWYVLDRPTG